MAVGNKTVKEHTVSGELRDSAISYTVELGGVEAQGDYESGHSRLLRPYSTHAFCAMAYGDLDGQAQAIPPLKVQRGCDNVGAEADRTYD